MLAEQLCIAVAEARKSKLVADIDEFSKMNAVERMMDGHKPARTTIQAGALPMKGLRVEIDAIAYRK